MCEAALEALKIDLESNGLLPRPVVWKDVNCSGDRHPATLDSWDAAGDRIQNIPWTFGSVWVPGGVKATFKQTKSSTTGIKKSTITGSDQVEMILTNTEYLDSEMRTYDYVEFEYLDRNGGSIDTNKDVKYELCTGGVDIVISGDVYRGYAPQTAACDELIADICADSDDPRSKAPVHPCGCLKDEETLEDIYPNQVLPVRCMGANCASGGYVFDRMSNQKCDLTICREIVNQVGENLTEDTSAVIFCGQNHYTFDNGQVVFADRAFAHDSASGDFIDIGPRNEALHPDHNKSRTLMPWYYWVAIIGLLLLLSVGIGLYVRWRRSR